MQKPRVFISSVSGELAEARQAVANALHVMGYEADWQEVFETEQGDLRAMLQRRIRESSGVIQIVGHRYGSEPPSPDPEFGRVSYTQYEALFARSIGKPIWQFSTSEEFPSPDQPAESDDCQRLQAEYRNQVANPDSDTRRECDSVDSLKLGIHGINSELKNLRRHIRRWTVGISVTAILILAIAISIVMQQDGIDDEIGQVGESAETVTTSAIEARDIVAEETEKLKELSSAAEIEHARLRVEAAIASADRTMRGQVVSMEQLLAIGYSYAGATLDGISLADANLPKASFAGSSLRDCLLDRIGLPGGDLSAADLSFASIEGADLTAVSAQGAFFEYTNAPGAAFENSKLANASFFYSKLKGANFRNADLKGACLAFCDLTGADFTGADLTNAILHSSILDRAVLDDATIKNTDVTFAVAKELSLAEHLRDGFCFSGIDLDPEVRIWGDERASKDIDYRYADLDFKGSLYQHNDDYWEKRNKVYAIQSSSIAGRTKVGNTTIGPFWYYVSNYNRRGSPSTKVGSSTRSQSKYWFPKSVWNDGRRRRLKAFLNNHRDLLRDSRQNAPPLSGNKK